MFEYNSFLGKVEKKHYICAFLFFIFVLIINVVTFDNYRYEDIDDPWSLSFAYNFLVMGIEYDIVYKSEELGGVAYFGKLYAYLYGSILNIFGWTKFNAHMISTLLALGSLYIWFRSLNLIKAESKVVVTVVLLMLAFEPYISMAGKTRSDALAYFLCSFSFLLFIRKNYFLSGLIAMLAVETHPLGLSSFFYCLSYFIWKFHEITENKKKVILNIGSFSLGVLIGGIVYFSLHYQNIINIWNDINHFSGATSAGGSSNYLISYFFQAKGMRHLPEFFLLLVACFIYLKNKVYENRDFSTILLVVCIIQSLFLLRGNSNYAVFFFPSYIIFISSMFTKIKRSTLLLIFCFFLLAPQYAYLNKMNYRENSYTVLVEKLKEILPKDDGIPVFGSANEWFAFYDRNFHYYYLIGRKPMYSKFYLVEEDDFRKHQWSIPKRFSKKTVINQFIFNSENYSVLLYEDLNFDKIESVY